MGGFDFILRVLGYIYFLFFFRLVFVKYREDIGNWDYVFLESKYWNLMINYIIKIKISLIFFFFLEIYIYCVYVDYLEIKVKWIRLVDWNIIEVMYKFML